MENFCKGVGLGLVAGMCIGMVVLVKNKKLASKVKQGVAMAEEKIDEAKEAIAQKMQDGECCFEMGGETSKSDCVPCSNGANKDFNKKSKNQ